MLITGIKLNIQNFHPTKNHLKNNLLINAYPINTSLSNKSRVQQPFFRPLVHDVLKVFSANEQIEQPFLLVVLLILISSPTRTTWKEINKKLIG